MSDQNVEAKPAQITEVRQADWQHNVITVVGGKKEYCKRPCKRCPWRKDSVGEFPAEAFRLSAHTTYDMAQEQFGCHSRKPGQPATCAGFLLRGAEHNLSVRLSRISGQFKADVKDGGHELFDSYVEMAVANGVDPADPVLTPCRSNWT